MHCVLMYCVVGEDCAADPDITNIDSDNSACEDTNSGSTCAFTCATGYTASGVATCTAGAWDTPTCDASPCAADPVIDSIDSDNSACEGTNSGSTCAFTCATGHTASGVATCSAGAWDTPTCVAVCRRQCKPFRAGDDNFVS